MATQNIPSVSKYVIVWICLMVLLVLTVFAARFDLGTWSIVIALLIATAKGVLVLLYFMHLRFEKHITWIFAGAAILWLGIMIVLTMNDYVTRGWMISQ
jgi:cytochrome c oxidase subunit 4